MTAGPHTLTILQPGDDPAEMFGTFINSGLVHTVGQTLIVPAGQDVGGSTRIDDPVVCVGSLRGTGKKGMTLDGGLVVAPTGKVDLGAGRLYVEDVHASVAGYLSVRSEFIGGNGAGQLIQTGGWNRVGVTMMMGRWSGGDGSYILSDGRLTSDYIEVGGHGEGSMSLQAGECTADRKLTLGHMPTGSGTVTLTGASLRATDFVIGRQGRGLFTQTGGEATVDHAMTLGVDNGSAGRALLTGGRLEAGELIVGADGEGVLEIGSPDVELVVTNRLSIGPKGRLVAAPGSRIHLDTADMQIESTDQDALGELGNLSLIVRGNQTSPPRVPLLPRTDLPLRGLIGPRISEVAWLPGVRNISMPSIDEILAILDSLSSNTDPIQLDLTFEVVAADRGGAADVFADSIVLDTLELVGAAEDDEATILRLVDQFDNQPDFDGNEALYVRNLILGEGSILDLGIYNIYYLELVDLGGTIMSDPDAAAQARLYGDIDGNGQVDLDDFVAMKANFMSDDASWSQGDLTGDGSVDLDDFVAFKSVYDGGSAVVPEPATITMLMLGAGLCLRRRR